MGKRAEISNCKMNNAQIPSRQPRLKREKSSLNTKSHYSSLDLPLASQSGREYLLHNAE